MSLWLGKSVNGERHAWATLQGVGATVANTHNSFEPSFYLMSAAAVLLLMFSMRETAEVPQPRFVNR